MTTRRKQQLKRLPVRTVEALAIFMLFYMSTRFVMRTAVHPASAEAVAVCGCP